MAQYHFTDVDKVPLVDRFGKKAKFPRVEFFDRLNKQLDNFVNADVDSETKAK